MFLGLPDPDSLVRETDPGVTDPQHCSLVSWYLEGP